MCKIVIYLQKCTTQSSKVQSYVFRCLVLFQQRSKTQRYSVYREQRTEKQHICTFENLKSPWRVMRGIFPCWHIPVMTQCQFKGHTLQIRQKLLIPPFRGCRRLWCCCIATAAVPWIFTAPLNFSQGGIVQPRGVWPRGASIRCDRCVLHQEQAYSAVASALSHNNHVNLQHTHNPACS